VNSLPTISVSNYAANSGNAVAGRNSAAAVGGIMFNVGEIRFSRVTGMITEPCVQITYGWYDYPCPTLSELMKSSRTSRASTTPA
jgi:hypothetical protein